MIDGYDSSFSRLRLSVDRRISELCLVYVGLLVSRLFPILFPYVPRRLVSLSLRLCNCRPTLNCRQV